MKKEPARLFKDDMELFERMKGNYISEREQQFFESMRFRQEFQPTGPVDSILRETDNAEGIYIDREGLGEYIVAHVNNEGLCDAHRHVMTLSEALKINLKEAGLLNRDMTLIEWLRERDYANVSFNYTYDE